mmetsp:Transcript_15905/g.23710  ORF Transcript_15905/g.23710 Transcript_15905/m.23710 type:complete len:489 (-) Transcript_15905:227-1693(-)
MSSTLANGMRPRTRLSLSRDNNNANGGNAEVPGRRKNALRDLSNRAGQDAKSNADKNAAKRPRTRNSIGGRQQLIALAEDDDTKQASKPRRLSARLKEKKVQDDKVARAVDKKEKASAKALAKAATKKRRGSTADSKEQPAAKKIKTASNATKITMRQIGREAKSRLVTKISGEDQYVVHPEFRLERASFNGKNHTFGIPRHDLDDEDNVLRNTPYATDMIQHLYVAETKTRPTMYMANQNDVNSKMRAILVDWLVEVHMKFRLVPETLYLCVNIIDRYCKKVQVQRSKLQLVGVTALLIACKYEEIYPPEVRDCVYITDRAYQSSEVLDMEQDIVHQLGFRMTVPTAFPFLHRFFTLVKASDLVKHAASYYLERTLQEHDMLKWRPSEICAAAVVLALNHPELAKEDGRTLDRRSAFLPPIVLEYTGFSRTVLYDCAKEIAKKVAEEPVTASNRELLAVKKKYDQRKFLFISSEYALPTLPTRRSAH